MSDVDRFERWKRDSAVRQQSLYERYGDREWDAIPKCMEDADHIIRTKISWYAFNKNYEDLLETDKKKEKSAVDGALSKVFNKCFSNGEYIFVGCVYIDILLKDRKTSHTVPVLKTTKEPNEGKTIFYELFSGRVYYGGWKDYEEDNKLPECWMCYPREGTYRDESGLVLLDYCKSASYRSFVPEIDIAAGITGLLCTAFVTVSAVFPPLFALEMATIAAGAGMMGTGIYSVSRGVYKLHDRDTHEQPCTLSDPDALREWLSVILNAGGILTAGGSVLAKAATFGKFSGTSANAINLAATILRYTSVGVNGLGIVMMIIDLVIKFLDNDLQISDLNKLVSLCLLISNILISLDQAERVIRYIASQPQCIRNIFKMVRNTTTDTVKVIREYTCVPLEELLELITGDVVMYILRDIGLPRTIEIITLIHNCIRRKIGRDTTDMVSSIQDILKMFSLLPEFLLEVQKVCNKVEKWFNVALPDAVAKIKRTSLNNTWSPATSLQIADNFYHALEPINRSNRNDEAKNIVYVVNEVASELDCRTETEYLKITELVCDQLHSMCIAEFIVRRHDNATGYLTDEKKSELFGDILSQLERPSVKIKIMENFQKARQNFSATRKNLTFSKPLYQSPGNSVHHFEVPSEGFKINRFAFEAAGELLETNNLLKFRLFKLETIFCLTDYDKCLIFNYEIEEKSGKVKGIVILDK